MKQLILAAALATSAITAHASDVSLTCSYTGVDGSAQNGTIHLSPTANGASIGNQQYSLRTIGNFYVLIGRIGDEHTINRETLAYKIQAFGNVLTGTCEVSKSKNKI
jgi:hypothetical protein